jgi:hypothetical protein
VPAGDRYVEVPRAAFEAFFAARGFEPAERWGELAFEREVVSSGGRRPSSAGLVKVVVYTSVPFGGGRARPVGRDAVRVSVVFRDCNGGQHGVSSETKVLRTGTVEGVLERVLGRMREAWAAALGLGRCARCGAPAYADSGRCVVRACREGGGAPWARSA